MKKNILSISALLIVLASCGRSAVCSCSDLMLEMSKEMRQVKGDYTKLEAIQKKYEADFKKCEKLEEGKSEEERKKLLEELKTCDSFKEMEKLRKGK
jgi:hypothetical protein